MLNEKKNLSDLDSKIISSLLENGRITWNNLAKKLHVSRATITNHIKSLEVRNIIKGYSVVLSSDYKKSISQTKAFIHVRFSKGGSVFKLQKILSENQMMVGIWGITGDWDCLILVYGHAINDLAELRAYIDNSVPIDRMETRIILDEFPLSKII